VLLTVGAEIANAGTVRDRNIRPKAKNESTGNAHPCLRVFIFPSQGEGETRPSFALYTELSRNGFFGLANRQVRQT
jgi:hypothetical protein